MESTMERMERIKRQGKRMDNKQGHQWQGGPQRWSQIDLQAVGHGIQLQSKHAVSQEQQSARDDEGKGCKKKKKKGKRVYLEMY